MSDFSDFLERLIQEDGYSVYGFAQEAGVIGQHCTGF